MVKLITNTVCGCSVCKRSRTASATIAAPLPSEDGSGGCERLASRLGRATARMHEAVQPADDTSLFSSLPVQPTASTSKVPYLPPAAVRLPDELLEIIIGLARPALPPPSTQRKPLPLAWRTFSRLSLVHSRWHDVAKQELARTVLLRTPRQLQGLTQALKHGEVGGKVEEILLEFKETASGTRLDEADEAAIVSGSVVLADDPTAMPTHERDLIALFELCADKLKVLRLRGFGDPALVSLNPAIRQHLGNLEVFEYSPVDSAHAPSTANLILGLGSLPKLKQLVLHPSNRYLTPLRELPDLIVPVITRLLGDLPTLLSDPKLRPLYESAFDDIGLHHLTSLSLHSLALTPLTLLGFLFPSLTTLTSLTLSSTLFVGPVGALCDLLSLLAPQLEEFVWEDKLINPVATTAPAFLRHLGFSLPAEAYWELLKQLKKVKKLRLFSPHVFEPSPARAGFTLPPSLEELSLGSRNEVGSEDLLFWLEQVHRLLDSKEPSVEVVQEGCGDKAGEEETTVRSGEDLEETEGTKDEEAEGEEVENDRHGDDLGNTVTHDEDDPNNLSGSSTKSSLSTSTPPRLPSPASTSSFAVESPLPSSSSSTSPQTTRPSSAPPSLPSPPLHLPAIAKPPSSPPTLPIDPLAAASPPSSPPSSPPTSQRNHRPTTRKRRLSWRNPPLPSPALQLRRLTLCTIDTTVRDDLMLQDRIEEVVARGVEVQYHSLVVVVLETLELTRELRIDMLRTGQDGEWA